MLDSSAASAAAAAASAAASAADAAWTLAATAAADAHDALKALPLAGGTAARSLLSSAGGALLPLFTTREALALRGVDQEFRAAVAAYPWQDAATRIRGSLAAWRACFPAARAANVQQRQLPGDADWAHLAGDGSVRELGLACCGGVTDARLARLFPQLQRLDARACAEVTRQGLAALPCLQWADLRGCAQLQLGEEEGEGAGDLLEDGRFELGGVEACTYCQAPCVLNAEPCCRPDSWAGEGAPCKATAEGGEVPECCEACIAQRGCHVCRALECQRCTDEQDEDLGALVACVGRDIRPCQQCRRNVCTAVKSEDALCGGQCVECERVLCMRCGELEDEVCEDCSDVLCGMEPSVRVQLINAAVCSECRRAVAGYDCALGYDEKCKTAKRRADAAALAHHLREVAKARKEQRKRRRDTSCWSPPWF